MWLLIYKLLLKGHFFDVNRGEIFGLLGNDVCKDMKSIKEKICVQLQSSAYYNFLSLKEILELFGGFYSKRIDADTLLGMVDLEEKANQQVGNLSGGQKQRFSEALPLNRPHPSPTC